MHAPGVRKEAGKDDPLQGHIYSKLPLEGDMPPPNTHLPPDPPSLTSHPGPALRFELNPPPAVCT